MNLDALNNLTIAILINALFFTFTTVDGIMFHLYPNSQKCLREELRENVLISGQYEITEAFKQSVDYVVRDSKGHIFARKEDTLKGKFSFISETYDAYEICFFSRASSQQGFIQEVTLNVKTGVDAKNYDAVGEVAKLKPMELELRKLEDLAESISKDFEEMKKREEEMRNTNESTSSRVFYFSTFGMCCIIAVACWQVLYLRNYFKSKKLID